jgi:MarR family transcriptional regulator, 2-MHQ and catechol-resistance regulon repressor
MVRVRQGQTSGERVDARSRAWRGLLEVASFVTQRIDEDLRDQVGIDIQTYDALLHTKEAGKAGIRMTDLADRVLLTKAGLTALVDRLEDRGLLARQPAREDRRVKRIVLTPAGWELFRQAAAVHNATVEQWFHQHLDENTAQPLAQTLARIHQAHLAAQR